jgi:hypothetical protein
MKMNNGTGLEKFVCELYKDLGYVDVKKDCRLSKVNGVESVRGQIDLTYRLIFLKRYVECKQRTNTNVNFDDYSKFETTLKVFNIPTYLGEMVTNTYFDEKVKSRAKEMKVKLIDRIELLRLDALRKSELYLGIMVLRFIERLDTNGLKDALNYIYIRNLSLEQQIQKYTEIHSAIS